jgi:putative ABC transport system permease protein
MPVVYGVTPAYQKIANLQVAAGRFFDDAETTAAAPLAVIGEAAAATLFGVEDPVGKYIKINEQWFRVVGVAGPQLTVQSDVAGIPAQDRNHIIYVPLYASIFRLEDGQSAQKDEIDGIYLQMLPSADVPSAAALVRGVLDVAHRGAGDFTIVSPAELLAEQRRTQRIFEMVMVAIASISLLVGGIGIMNIMLASVLERTREIGVRRAIGARQRDVVRQFLIETTIISLTGGVVGILLGVGMSQLIGVLAGWSTIVTTMSIVLAFGVSVAIGIVFGLYPAVRASRLDPVKALHYE